MFKRIPLPLCVDKLSSFFYCRNMSKNNMYIAGAIIVVLAIVGAVVYATNMKKDSDKKSESSSSLSSASMSKDNVMVGGAAMFANKNIVENVSNASNLTTLVTAVKAADLVETLQGPGPFTVFAPNNDAFKALPAGTVETLVKPESKATLQDILKYHVVSGKYIISDLKDGQTLTTVQGQTLKVTKKDGKTMINNAEIETPDVLQSNGVAHVITKVLLPNSNPTVGGAAMSKDLDLVSNISNAPNLTTVVAAIKAADLVDALKGPGPFTAFGPDNTAFGKVPAATLTDLLKPENKATLQAVLQYHVVSGKYLVADLTNGQELTTLNGQKLTVVKEGSVVKLQSTTAGNIATITTADVVQSNGVAHVIDTVLLPKS